MFQRVIDNWEWDAFFWFLGIILALGTIAGTVIVISDASGEDTLVKKEIESRNNIRSLELQNERLEICQNIKEPAERLLCTQGVIG